MSIILASNSKRRSQILSSCGIKHKIIVSNVEEIKKGASPPKIVKINARSKAESVARNLKAGYVIGADTVCLLDREIIGKPRNLSHAQYMLRAMSGKAVSVYTGICVIDAKTKRSVMDYEKTEVRVKKIEKEEFSALFRLPAPYDKAGGFSIEGVGAFIFDDIKGSYFNVLGLPMARLKDMFERLRVDILSIIGR